MIFLLKTMARKNHLKILLPKRGGWGLLAPNDSWYGFFSMKKPDKKSRGLIIYGKTQQTHTAVTSSYHV